MAPLSRRRQLPAEDVQIFVGHDVSGKPSPGSPLPYHRSFDEKGIYDHVPLDQRAPHAASFNDKSIGLAHRGFEGEQLSHQAIVNGSDALQGLQREFPGRPIKSHYELGSAATLGGSKDPREGSWIPAVARDAQSPYLGDPGGADLPRYSPLPGGQEPVPSPSLVASRSAPFAPDPGAVTPAQVAAAPMEPMRTVSSVTEASVQPSNLKEQLASLKHSAQTMDLGGGFTGADLGTGLAAMGKSPFGAIGGALGGGGGGGDDKALQQATAEAGKGSMAHYERQKKAASAALSKLMPQRKKPDEIFGS